MNILNIVKNCLIVCTTLFAGKKTVKVPNCLEKNSDEVYPGPIGYRGCYFYYCFFFPYCAVKDALFLASISLENFFYCFFAVKWYVNENPGPIVVDCPVLSMKAEAAGSGSTVHGWHRPGLYRVQLYSQNQTVRDMCNICDSYKNNQVRYNLCFFSEVRGKNSVQDCIHKNVVSFQNYFAYRKLFGVGSITSNRVSILNKKLRRCKYVGTMACIVIILRS